MNTSLLDRYGGAVPRYTSYPTAPHFHDGIDGAVYTDWLRTLPRDSVLSLYFHVPFCRKMCWYCGCHTKVVNRTEPIAEYAGYLKREVEVIAAVAGQGRLVSHVHWGGGTPSILADTDFTAIMAAVNGAFQLTDNAEVAIEIDPRTVSREQARVLAAAGVNRASLGIQDFNPDIQEAINRVQSYEQTAEVVGWLRESGIDAINFDLMYGLPGQVESDVVRTVDLSMKLRPDRLSIFGYAHVPWMKTHQKQIDENALPDGPERMRQALATSERLVEHGYKRIGLDHFARPEDSMAEMLDDGDLHRNFQGYTTDVAAALIGFGASAIGSLPQGYVQNAPSIRQYKRMIEAGEPPIVKGIELDDEDRMRRELIERLMCDMQVDLGEVAGHYGHSGAVFAAERVRLADMETDGIVRLEGDGITVTEDGRPFVRTVCAVFDSYLSTGRGRHSRAV